MLLYLPNNGNYSFEQKITTALRRTVLFVTLLLALAAAMYYGYKGLLWLSDWMNEAEVQRQRRRNPRI